MRCSGSEVGIACAPKHSEVMVRGKFTMESKEGSRHVESFGGESVKDIGSSGEGVSPVGGRHGRLKEKCANDIIGGAESALSFAILLRGVGT